MRSGKLLAFVAFIITAAFYGFGQMQPNLDNGFKNYGSFHGSNIDSVELSFGNWMLHSPLISDIGQRGALTPHYFVSVNSKNWQIQCHMQSGTITGVVCNWNPGRNGAITERSDAITLHRTVDMFGSGTGTVTYEGYGYTISTADGATHQMYGIPGTEDANGDATAYESIDTSGYHLALSNLDSNGIWAGFTVIDRHGNQYAGGFGAYQNCTKPQGNELPNVGGHAPIIDDAPFGDRYCSQTGFARQITDANGNWMTYHGPQYSAAGVDTVGRGQALATSTSVSDFSGCVSRFAITAAYTMPYSTPAGTEQAKLCYAHVPVQTAFNATAYGGPVGEASDAVGYSGYWQLVTLILADGSKWTFDYDSYWEVTSVGLPTGGSITLTWTTINRTPCNDPTYLSRAVASRTVTDNNGHSSTWNYAWGAPANGAVTNTVTDPLGNDTVHMFTDLSGNGCGFYETHTQYYQGTGSYRQLLKRVDTTYSSTTFDLITQAASGLGNVVPTSVQTTAYPSGRVSLVTKAYDAGLGAGAPIFANVVAEKVYDWGEGTPGTLLRETDTTYQWQVNSSYLAAHIVDLPASVVIKDGSGNRLAETDYFYDEAAYLTNSGTTTQHGDPPGPVRGNLTTVKKWLNPGNTWITSHTNWYDTGEVYQQIDPLGHTTTHSYDPYYVGAYSTKTCNALTQCVSGTYDFNTGVLTSFTDQNASNQASGNTAGDSNHTSNYSYDNMFRLTSAQFPPDNAGHRPQTTFTYSTPNLFPLTVQRLKTITTATNDTATAYFDGLGRSYQTQHATPSGNVKVDTSYDALDQVVQVTNPYFSTADTTYGVVQTQHDALGRVKQTTEQDGSVATVGYIDNCTITTDEAGKQRRACTNALGQLTSVDEPGEASAGASPVVSGGGAGATGSVTLSGSEQSTSVYNPPSGDGGGQTCDPGVICDGGSGGGGGYTTVYDAGTVSLTVNGIAYTTQYGQNDTPSTIAANLATAVNQDQFAVVTASASGGTVTLTSEATGTQITYSLSASWTWDTTDFTNPSFSATTSGNVSGGTDGAPVFGGHAYTTLYTYDGLGNLLKVTQQGGTSDQTKWRVRTFAYDSLSRLLTADNPESGTITYIYDSDSNLLTKTDARGITVNYSPADSPIDALHRVTKKTYSDNTTPSSSFVYDQANPWNWSTTLGNPVGRLVAVNTGGSNGVSRVFSYDGLGRITTEWQCLVGCPAVSAQYDLANDLTYLFYPSGRTIKYSYNSATQLDGVTYDNWNGNTSGYVYWSVDDSNFYPNGTPKLVTLGNGVTEATALNTRLQLLEDTVTNGSIGTLADHAYSYGTQGTNNGNILSVNDQINPARTQTFTYDAMNRLATANESRWGLSFVYDPWGNRLQQNVTDGSAGGSNLTVDSNNRIMGAPSNCTIQTTYCYDAAGNLLNDGFHKYVFDGESRISNVDSGNATYTYDADGNRVLKSISGGPSTVYFYFGGQAVSELDVTNNYWTDYISAGGKRIAKADTFINMARTQGTCSTPSSGCKSTFWFRNSGLIGYTIQSGDKLYMTQNVSTNSLGGPGLTYRDANGNVTQGDAITNVFDQNGCPMNQDCSSWANYYRFRRMDLTPLAGMTIADDPLVETTWTSNTSGSWEGLWGDFVLVSADGTVRPIFAGTAWGQSISMTSSNQAGTSNVLGFIDKELCWMCVGLTNNFYHDDQIGSSRLLTAGGGWPTWQGTFLPYGEEYNPQITSNHYKFSGKEWDSETNLDYFGARYYGNTLGRWLTPDWAVKAAAVPYAEFADPQSLNLYSYVRNVPTSRFDADGHFQKKEEMKPREVEAKEEAEANEKIERARQEGEKIEAREEADKEVEARAKFAKENPNGYDDLNGVCHVRPPLDEVEVGAPHGNTAGNQYAELYAKYDKDGNFLKWGVSQDSSTRYNETQLNGGRTEVITTGTRKDMLATERYFTERAPGPENHERWAGTLSSPAARAQVGEMVKFLKQQQQESIPRVSARP